MQDRNPSPSLPPSGPWSGHYHYAHDTAKHRMKLGLPFGPDGKMHGEGIDDIAEFIITGFFDIKTNQASWAKAYIGMHSVEYRGLYDGRSICGDWSLIVGSGAFWIWPSGLHERVTESIEEELDQPAHEVHLSVRIAESLLNWRRDLNGAYFLFKSKTSP